MLWLFSPAWDALKVDFICPFVVIGPTDLGATTELLFQTLCFSTFNQAPTRNTCLFTDGNQASLSERLACFFRAEPDWESRRICACLLRQSPETVLLRREGLCRGSGRKDFRRIQLLRSPAGLFNAKLHATERRSSRFILFPLRQVKRAENRRPVGAERILEGRVESA